MNKPKPQHSKSSGIPRKYTVQDKEMIRHLREFGLEVLKANRKFADDQEKCVMHMEIALVKMLGIIRHSNYDAMVKALDTVLTYPILTGNVDATTVPRAAIAKMKIQIQKEKNS